MDLRDREGREEKDWERDGKEKRGEGREKIGREIALIVICKRRRIWLVFSGGCGDTDFVSEKSPLNASFFCDSCPPENDNSPLQLSLTSVALPVSSAT